MSHKPVYSFFVLCILSILFSSCAPQQATPTEPVIALTHLRLIDGTGAAPLEDAVVLVSGERISAAGPAAEIAVPAGAQVIDLQGATLLPGLINAHVHYGFSEEKLAAWAQAGVTTVRDMGNSGSTASMKSNYAHKAEINARPKLARLVASTPIISPPQGYGELAVTSAQDAVEKVNSALDLGADLVKIAFEDYRPPSTKWPLLPLEQAQAIVEVARQRGVRTSAHITWAKYAQTCLDAGVDEIAHMPMDALDDAIIAQAVEQGVMWIPTLELWDKVGQGTLPTAIKNTRRFVAAGGQVALGTDYGGYPGAFDLGLPLTELLHLQVAGLTPLEAITAATRNGAIACGLADELGTIEAGKIADLLAVDGDPSEDLTALQNVRLVMHNGVVIRGE